METIANAVAGINLQKNEEGTVKPYLHDYLVDKWARDRMEDPIEFDWGRVSYLHEIEVDEEWDKTPLALHAKEKGFNFVMVVCECPNPEHGIMKHIMNVPPSDFDKHCPKCIDREMLRIMQLRLDRKYENMKREK